MIHSRRTHYDRLRNRIVPRLRFNQAIYKETLSAIVLPHAVWLDAGCGWKLLPEWEFDAERALLNRARLVVGCDLDRTAVARHRSLRARIICDLSALPFKPGSFDLITCNMVMEHVERPAPTLKEFARTLRRNGTVVIHTPYRWSYFARLAALCPDRLKRALRPDGREAVDYYPVQYRCNTPRALRRLGFSVGLTEVHTAMFASDAVTVPLAESWLGRLLLCAELYWLRLSLHPWFRLLRVTMCAVYRKG